MVEFGSAFSGSVSHVSPVSRERITAPVRPGVASPIAANSV